jgi:hypothetical protein
LRDRSNGRSIPIALLGGRAVVMTGNGQIDGIPLNGGDLQFVLRRKKDKFKADQYCYEGMHFRKYDLERGGDRLFRWLEWNAQFCRSSPSAFSPPSLSAPKCLGLPPMGKLA